MSWLLVLAIYKLSSSQITEARLQGVARDHHYIKEHLVRSVLASTKLIFA
jgi:hypothetical protein